MIRVTLDKKTLQVVRTLRASRALILEAVRVTMDLQNELTVGHIQERKLSRRGSETLGVVTNRLRSSVRPAVARIRGSKVLSAIGSNVKYMGAHEYGTDPYDIHARRGSSLRFAIGGRELFRKRVRHPGHKERAPIRKGTEERLGQYQKALSTAIVEVYSA